MRSPKEKSGPVAVVHCSKLRIPGRLIADRNPDKLTGLCLLRGDHGLRLNFNEFQLIRLLLSFRRAHRHSVKHRDVDRVPRYQRDAAAIFLTIPMLVLVPVYDPLNRNFGSSSPVIIASRIGFRDINATPFFLPFLCSFDYSNRSRFGPRFRSFESQLCKFLVNYRVANRMRISDK